MQHFIIGFSSVWDLIRSMSPQMSEEDASVLLELFIKSYFCQSNGFIDYQDTDLIKTILGDYCLTHFDESAFSIAVYEAIRDVVQESLPYFKSYRIDHNLSPDNLTLLNKTDLLIYIAEADLRRFSKGQ